MAAVTTPQPTNTSTKVTATPNSCVANCAASGGHGGNLVLVLVIIGLLIFIWGYSAGRGGGHITIEDQRH